MSDAYPLALAAECGEPSIEDRLAWLMDTYERRVYTFLLMLVRIPALAEDCAQDTFLRAYENLRKGKPVNAGWLFKVARNRALDELSARSRVHLGDDQFDELVAPTESEADEEVWETMRQLPQPDREVLYLFAVEGLKTDEIGTILRIRGSAVRQRLYRARQRFRAAYEP